MNIFKNFRLMKGLSLTELSEKIEPPMHKSNLSSIELGKRMPMMDVRLRISRALNMDPVSLSGIELTDTDEMRLLIKLINKFKIKTSYNNEENTLIAELPNMFAGYAYLHEEIEKKLSFEKSNNKVSPEEYRQMEIKYSQMEKYWIETYPEFDFQQLTSPLINLPGYDTFKVMLPSNEDVMQRLENSFEKYLQRVELDEQDFEDDGTEE